MDNNTFQKLRSINVNDKTENKDGLKYLSWAWAWDEFKQACPDATYEVVKNDKGLPYFESDAGAMVYTKVTASGQTHEMWLPVMDSSNKAMKNEPYKYQTRNGERLVQAYTMFDINKTLMRCLVKNLAMFGFAIYIYAGEDVPSDGESAPQASVESRLSTYIVPFGKKFKGMKLQDIPIKEIESFIEYLEREGKGKPMSDQAREFIEIGTAFVNGFGDNGDSEFDKFSKSRV